MKPRIVMAVCLALLVVGATAPGATAHKAKYKAVLEISAYLTEGAFIGVVGGFDEPKCDRKRKVTVWGENPGAMDGPVGTVKTDRKGDWRLDFATDGGTFYATMPAKTLKSSAEHKHVCKADQSPKFTFPLRR
jgi:hypothetical protein